MQHQYTCLGRAVVLVRTSKLFSQTFPLKLPSQIQYKFTGSLLEWPFAKKKQQCFSIQQQRQCLFSGGTI